MLKVEPASIVPVLVANPLVPIVPPFLAVNVPLLLQFVPVTVMLVPAMSARMVPWLTRPKLPAPTVPLWGVIGSGWTVIPAPRVNVPLVGCTKLLPLLPAKTTSPVPPRVWVPLKFRLAPTQPLTRHAPAMVTTAPPCNVRPLSTVALPLPIVKGAPKVTPSRVPVLRSATSRPAPPVTVAWVIVPPDNVAPEAGTIVRVPPPSDTVEPMLIVPPALSVRPPAVIGLAMLRLPAACVIDALPPMLNVPPVRL